MSEKRKKFDENSPDAEKLREEIHHGAFVREGTMLAFPTCLPGATISIVSDESHVTALDRTPEGHIYGGTSGKRSHLFVGMFHGVTGMVFDMKLVEGATHCAAVCCGRTKFLACVNGPTGGGRVLRTRLEPLPYDVIQEWGFERPEFDELGEVVPGEPIVHAIADAGREQVVGITSRHIFRLDIETGKIQVVGENAGTGRLAVGSRGNIFGREATDHLWRYDPHTQTLARRAASLPAGAWDKGPLFWARDPRQGLLYTADGQGRLFSFDEEKGFSASLGKTMLTPVGPMAVTFDGRLFGFCGDGIAKLFCYDPARKAVSSLGVAVSLFERRRYGYVFGDAVTGRDGEIVFGENDDFGHLWLYFPRIRTT